MNKDFANIVTIESEFLLYHLKYMILSSLSLSFLISTMEWQDLIDSSNEKCVIKCKKIK